jgi:DNA processing protein
MDSLQKCLMLSHVATQLYRRWFEFDWESSQQHSFACNHDFDDGDVRDWEDFLYRAMESRVERVFPLVRFLKLNVGAVSGIARALVDHLKLVKASGGHMIFIHEDDYPPLLTEIPKPPLVLTVRGSPSVLTAPPVSVVGSRQANYFGIRESLRLGELLASSDYAVVSGGAIGCDIAVHQGMLLGGAFPIKACVVFAGGLGFLYPRRHQGTFDRIVENGGVLVSERLWWQESRPFDFPIRNRIVSGMSGVIVVMQAGEFSGAMVTASTALDQGRDVYVMRHDQSDVRAQGSLALIGDGAEGFDSAVDIASKLVHQPTAGPLASWGNQDLSCRRSC